MNASRRTALVCLASCLCWLSHTGKRRYNIKLWKTFTDCFNCLPIAAIIDEKIFTCVLLRPTLHFVQCAHLLFCYARTECTEVSAQTCNPWSRSEGSCDQQTFLTQVCKPSLAIQATTF